MTSFTCLLDASPPTTVATAFRISAFERGVFFVVAGSVMFVGAPWGGREESAWRATTSMRTGGRPSSGNPAILA
ncbi:MAG: hypothetical protein ACRENE_09055, partial [Polyangiaceae bacterium]